MMEDQRAAGLNPAAEVFISISTCLERAVVLAANGESSHILLYSNHLRVTFRLHCLWSLFLIIFNNGPFIIIGGSCL
jgi:hypothetical protein